MAQFRELSPSYNFDLYHDAHVAAQTGQTKVTLSRREDTPDNWQVINDAFADVGRDLPEIDSPVGRPDTFPKKLFAAGCGALATTAAAIILWPASAQEAPRPLAAAVAQKACEGADSRSPAVKTTTYDDSEINKEIVESVDSVTIKGGNITGVIVDKGVRVDSLVVCDTTDDNHQPYVQVGGSVGNISMAPGGRIELDHGSLASATFSPPEYFGQCAMILPPEVDVPLTPPVTYEDCDVRYYPAFAE